MNSAMHVAHKRAVSVCAANQHVRLDEKRSSCNLQIDHVNVCIGMLIIHVIPATSHDALQDNGIPDIRNVKNGML